MLHSETAIDLLQRYRDRRRASARERCRNSFSWSLETDIRLEDRTLLSNSIPLSATSWTAIGPAPVLGGQVSGSGPVSGRITGIAVKPTDPNTIYIAAAGGGVWKTTNGGTNWAPLTDNLTDSNGNPVPLFMGAIAIDPLNPNIIYAGTGEANNSGDSYYGRGILKSTDGGSTWTLINDGGSFERRTIAKIVVDPSNDNNVYVAVDGFAANGLSGNTGIYKSINGGTTWTNTTIASGLSSFDEYSDLVIDPHTPSTLFMAIGSYFGNTPNGVYKSTNSGGSWSLISALPSGSGDGRIALALTPDSSTLYVSIAEPLNGSSIGGQLFKLEKYATVSGTVTDLTSTTPNYMGANGFGQGWYDTTLAVDPQNANIIYAGGSDNGESPESGNIVSTNGGQTWVSVVTGSNGNGPHTDDHAAVFDSSGQLLSGNDGGIFRLNPISLAWTDLNSNLETIQFTGIALDPTNNNIAYGGSQDNGTEKFNDNLRWNLSIGDDGGFVRVDPNNPSTVYHTFTGISLQRSDDGGITWHDKVTGITGTPNFYASYVMDPSNSSRLVFGTADVFLTTNKGDSWSNISNGQLDGSSISALAIAKTSGNTIYATTNIGNIYVTTNGGTNWNQIDVPVVNGPWHDIEVDPTNSQTVYVARNAFTGNQSEHVFRSTNGGASWTDISTSLPDTPVNSLALKVQGSNTTLYAGTDLGVYSSSNLGTSWSRFQTGMPFTQVVSLEYNANLNILAAGTHGRGMWEILAQVVATATTTTLTSSANPSTFGQNVTFTATVAPTSGTGTPTGTVTFEDGLTVLGSGALSGGVATFSISTLAVGSHSITAVYGGDTNGAGSTSSAVSQVVNQDSTTTALTSSVNPSVFDQSVTFTATVTANPPGSGTPTGTVTFKDGTATLGTGALSGGVATFSISTLAVGLHSITAVYSGDSNFTTSTSPTLTQTVNQYKIVPLYDQTAAKTAGSTIPIKIEVTDFSGNDVSSPSLIVTAMGYAPISVPNAIIITPVPFAGNSNPEDIFRFDPTLGTSGGYIFNLKTTGFASGPYILYFTILGDPTQHSVLFTVK
jgi:photosystem II stability/assembly factor-like uncharacterized protein